jgi:hypothetical protein
MDQGGVQISRFGMMAKRNRDVKYAPFLFGSNFEASADPVRFCDLSYSLKCYCFVELKLGPLAALMS